MKGKMDIDGGKGQADGWELLGVRRWSWVHSCGGVDLRQIEDSYSVGKIISMNLFELARMNYLAYALGNPQPVPEEDIKEYQSRWERGLRHMQREANAHEEPSEWRYYRKLIGE